MSLFLHTCGGGGDGGCEKNKVNQRITASFTYLPMGWFLIVLLWTCGGGGL